MLHESNPVTDWEGGSLTVGIANADNLTGISNAYYSNSAGTSQLYNAAEVAISMVED